MWNRAITLIAVTLAFGVLTFVFLDHAAIFSLLWMVGSIACIVYGALGLRVSRCRGITLIAFGILQMLAFFVVPQFLKV